MALDQKIMSAASQISSQYSDILSLGTRQTMGALDFTVGTDSSGRIVPDDVKIFMKNLGTDRLVLLFTLLQVVNNNRLAHLPVPTVA